MMTTTIGTTTVSKFMRFAIAALAAATVSAVSLAAPATASAMPMSCSTAMKVADTYIATGQVFQAVGAYQSASYWFGKAAGLLTAAC